MEKGLKVKKMASVYELARQLGKELMNTPEVAELLEAKKIYEADTEIVKLIQEYSALQEDFEIRFAAGKTTEEEQKAFREEMTKRGEVIKANQAAANLFAAESKFNQFMSSVFSIVTATLAGDDPSQTGGCNPSCCSSCGGGCH